MGKRGREKRDEYGADAYPADPPREEDRLPGGPVRARDEGRRGYSGGKPEGVAEDAVVSDRLLFLASIVVGVAATHAAFVAGVVASNQEEGDPIGACISSIRRPDVLCSLVAYVLPLSQQADLVIKAPKGHASQQQQQLEMSMFTQET